MIVQISDLHVISGPDGEPSVEALKEVVAGIQALPLARLGAGQRRPGPDGAREDYELVKELLAPLGDSVVAIPGNHDDPALVAELFGDPGEVEVAGVRLVLCDTTLPGTDAGRIDTEALGARLAATTARR